MQENFIKMDKSGRVVIPLNIRKYMGISDETVLHIEYDHINNKIILENAYGTCEKCGSKEVFLPFISAKKKICNECISEMINSITGNLDDRKEQYDGYSNDNE